MQLSYIHVDEIEKSLILFSVCSYSTTFINFVHSLNTRTNMKLRTSISRSTKITVFDPFKHWVDSTYRESGSPTLLHSVIIDGDVISVTIGTLKHDSFI